MHDRLLIAFRSLFEGQKYEHRRSNLGDYVVSFLYEDLVTLNRSPKLAARVQSQRSILNTANIAVGKRSRRGDGTFGESVPGVAAIVEPPFLVARGRIASIEIGAESKILAKAMIKQIDRVIGDLGRQAQEFRKIDPQAICVGFVGINQADRYLSFEGKRKFATDGKKQKHPNQEAAEAERRLIDQAKPHFDEFLILRFAATNFRPFPFHWLDEAETKVEYAALLSRVCRKYEDRY